MFPSVGSLNPMLSLGKRASLLQVGAGVCVAVTLVPRPPVPALSQAAPELRRSPAPAPVRLSRGPGGWAGEGGTPRRACVGGQE